MKKLSLLIASMLVCSSVLAGNGSCTVTNGALKILPSPSMIASAAFATNTLYTNGQYRVSGGRTYMVLTAGTSGPTNPTGVNAVHDGGIFWFSVSRQRRQGLAVGNIGGTGTLYVTIGERPFGTAGIPLAVGSSLVLAGDQAPQAEIWAVSSQTNVAATVEW